MSRSITLLVIATAAALTFGLAGCTGSSTVNTQVPVAAVPIPEPTPLEVHAYPSVGNTIGVVGEGDSLACDSSLQTLHLNEVGSVEYNGSIVTYMPDYTPLTTTKGEDYGIMNKLTLSFAEGQPDIQAAIVRLSDSFPHDNEGTLEYLDYPLDDLTVNWLDDLASASSVVFDTVEFGSINGIKAVDLCISVTPVPKE